MSESRPAGPILDELGVTLDLAEHDRVTEVMVLAKTTDLATGDVALIIGSSDLDWIAQIGLHAAGGQVLHQGDVERDG